MSPDPTRMAKRLYSNEYLILVLIWIVPTCINLNKAFHIDDTFHLEAAKWIIGHPLQPMSGMINWYDDPEPMSHANQPALYFYVVALWGKLLGLSEISLHIMQSIFTFLCILFFFRLAKLFSEKNAIALTILFAFNPAFIANQNLMTDVPLLSALLAFVYTLVRPGMPDSKRYLTAAFVLSVGLLIKYSLLPLLPVLALTIIYHRKYCYLFVVLLPVSFLAAWSAWNYYEFGAVHLFNRGGAVPFGKMVYRAEVMTLCLGGVAFFVVFILQGIFYPFRRITAVIGSVIFMALPLFAVLAWQNVITENAAKDVLSLVFQFKGWMIVASLVYALLLFLFKRPAFDRSRPELTVIFLYLGAVALFIVRYAPFIATRHVLLVLPAILLISSVFWERTTAYVRYLALTGVVISGIVLGLSDRLYADYYRRAAGDIGAHTAGASKVWSVGHWGWQWYSREQGYEIYGQHTSHLSNGDLVVMPQRISRQNTAEAHLKKVGAYWYPPGIISFFCVSRRAGFYSTSLDELPWELSRTAIDTIEVYRVDYPTNSGAVIQQ